MNRHADDGRCVRAGGGDAPAPAARAGLSDPDHQDDQLVRRRRRLRHRRPHHRAAAAGEARPVRRGGEPARRRRPARQRGGREFAEGRLHARRPDRRPDHHAGDDQERALRRGRVVRLDRADRGRRPADRGAAGLSATRTSSRWSRPPRPSPARSCSPARASARRSISPPSCSSRSPASTCCTCPIAPRRRRSRACSARTPTCCSTP